MLESHPIANIFPMMSEDVFAAFLEDVKARGFEEPDIWLYEPTREGFLRLYPGERAYFARHAREPAEPAR